MADLPTRGDLFNLGRDFIQRSSKVDPRQVDVEGSDVNLMVGSTSVMANQVITQLGYRVNALTLDGAEDEDLDRYALDRYGIVRKGASPALGSVKFFRANALAGGGTIDIGTKIVTLTNIEYITTSTASFGGSDLSSTANVRALQAGKISQVDVGTITKISDPNALFDATMQVTNDAGTAGGEDAESNDIFRERIRNFWITARRGILSAIEQGALTVPGVVTAQAIEETTTGSMPARVVTLYIADSSGVSNEALALQVKTALNDYRAGGIAVVIATSLPLIVNITLSLSFQAGVDTVTLSDNVRAALVEFTNSIPVNGTLYKSQLYSVIQRFTEDGVIPRESSITSPTGDLVPAVGQTIRTTLSNVTVG